MSPDQQFAVAVQHRQNGHATETQLFGVYPSDIHAEAAAGAWNRHNPESNFIAVPVPINVRMSLIGYQPKMAQ